MSHLPERNLDVLRSIAVTCVLGSHAIDPWVHHIGLLTTWQLGRIGVLLFFVHTSLVLMASLERLRVSHLSTWAWIKTFYIRRALRIYPLAIAAVMIVAALQIPVEFMNRGAHPQYIRPTLGTLVANFGLVQNLFYQPDVLGPLWSLPLEVQMYLVLPLLYLVAKRSLKGTLVVLGLAIAVGLAVHYTDIPGVGRLTILTFAPCFLSGVLAYSLSKVVSPKIPGWFWLIGLALCGSIFILSGTTAQSMQRAWPFCIAVGLLIPFVRDLPTSPFTRLANIIAKYSYSIYLSHVILLWIAFVVFYTAAPAVEWAIFAIGIGIVPAIAYRYIESPGIRLGVRLSKAREVIPSEDSGGYSITGVEETRLS